MRGTMMASVLYGRCLYGAECHCITKRNAAYAAHHAHSHGDAQGRRPDSGRLLVESGGNWETELVRIKRMVKHWQHEVAGYEAPTGSWDRLQGTTGKQGPISRTRHELEEFGIGCTDMHTWNIEGKKVPVSGTQDLARQVPGAARAALRRAQATRRLHLRGLEKAATRMQWRRCWPNSKAQTMQH